MLELGWILFAITYVVGGYYYNEHLKVNDIKAKLRQLVFWLPYLLIASLHYLAVRLTGRGE